MLAILVFTNFGNSQQGNSFMNALLDMYAKCGEPEMAVSLWHKEFEGQYKLATSHTYICILEACALLGADGLGKLYLFCVCFLRFCCSFGRFALLLVLLAKTSTSLWGL